MKFISNNLIKLDRELSDLDLFALDFIKILKKFANYVVISGYASILLGRARASEDIDILIPKMEFLRFKLLLKKLIENEFYCLNADKPNEIYSYLKERLGVRFAKRNTVIPNVELKFAKNKIDDITLAKRLTVNLNNGEIIISHLEMQIAFKEVVLKSPKDIEDARHIRSIAKGHLDEGLIRKYRRVLNEFYK